MSSPMIREWLINPSEVQRGRVIGSGGFGFVCTGTWKGSSVALKYISKEKVALLDAKVVANSEAELLSRLRHPHIIEFFGAHVDGPEPFIVMAYHQHGDARSFIQANPGCDRLQIVYGTVLGLAYLHSLKINHGDLKALNILVDDAFKAVICDLGSSRIKADTLARMSNSEGDVHAGSRGWMAPERLAGKRMRLPSDIYSLAMTIHELYTLEIPFADVFPGRLLDMVAKEHVRPERPEPEELNEDGKMVLIPDDVWHLVEQCWKTDPADRPSADAVRQVLIEIAGSNFASKAEDALSSSLDIQSSSSRGVPGNAAMHTQSRIPPSISQTAPQFGGHRQPLAKLQFLPFNILLSIFTLTVGGWRAEQLLYDLSATCHTLHEACLAALFVEYIPQYRHSHNQHAIVLDYRSMPPQRSLIIPALQKALFLPEISEITINLRVFDRMDHLGHELQLFKSLVIRKSTKLDMLCLKLPVLPSIEPHVERRLSKDLQDLLRLAVVEKSCRSLAIASTRSGGHTPVPEPLRTAPQNVYKRNTLCSFALESEICLGPSMFHWTLDFLHQTQPTTLEVDQHAFTPRVLGEAIQLIHLTALRTFRWTNAVSAPIVLDPLVGFLSRHGPGLERLDFMTWRVVPGPHYLRAPFLNVLSRTTQDSGTSPEPWVLNTENGSANATVYVIDFGSLVSLSGNLHSINWVLTANVNALIRSMESKPSGPPMGPIMALPPSLSLTFSNRVTIPAQSGRLKYLNEALTTLALTNTLWRSRSGGSGLVWRRLSLTIDYWIIGSLAAFMKGHSTSSSPLRSAALQAAIYYLSFDHWPGTAVVADDWKALSQLLTLLPELEELKLDMFHGSELWMQGPEFWQGMRRSCPRLKEIKCRSGHVVVVDTVLKTF